MSFVLATPVRSAPSKNTSMMSRARSCRRRSSCGVWLLTKFISQLLRCRTAKCVRPSPLAPPADDVSRNHPAARGDVGQLREREAREGRAYSAVEEQRVEVDQLLGEEDRAVLGERGEGLARRRDALLH